MRFYSLALTTQDGQPVRGADGQPFGPWTTVLPAGNPATPTSGPVNPGALRIKFDIPVISADIPAGGCPITLWGVPLPVLYQTAKFNPAPDFSTFCRLTLQAGMAPGLPLATAAFNARQTGLILSGAIQQAYGNWEGTSQQLDFIVIPTPGGTNVNPPVGDLGTSENPRNFQLNWSPGQALGDAITKTLTTAFPGVDVVGAHALSALLVLPTPSPVQWAAHGALEDFAQMIQLNSRAFVRGQTNAPSNYQGVKILVTSNGFSLYDGTGGLSVSVHKGNLEGQLQFNDLIGQPTWLSPVTLTFKTVLRADFKVGDFVKMPVFKTSSGQNVPIPTATTATSWSQYRDKSAFTGTFQITGLRHMGDSRQASGDSWVTVFEANALTPQPQATGG